MISKKLKKIPRHSRFKIILALLLGFVLIVFGAISFFGNNENVGEANSQFIEADFIDLSKIYAISKFRSGTGHDFSGSGETCRSMKHYFNVQQTTEFFEKNPNGMPPKPDGVNDISIFSPVTGQIVNIQEEQTPIGVQVYIKPDVNKSYIVRLFHIYLFDNFKKGSKVKAGEKIGVISGFQNTDIAVSIGSFFNQKFISYFDVMTDEVFQKYKERGAKEQKEFIISKEERDAKPLECNGEQFAKNIDSEGSNEHYVFLSGYKSPYFEK